MHTAHRYRPARHVAAARASSAPRRWPTCKQWLEDPALAEFQPDIQALVDRGEWSELEDAFYKHINIGTGGIRGAIGPGPNRINTRTIGEAAQALCQFIDARGEAARQGGVVVGHEARQGSVDFARVCSEVFAANGIRSFRFDGVREHSRNLVRGAPPARHGGRADHRVAQSEDRQRLQVLLVLRRPGRSAARRRVHAARHAGARHPPLATRVRRRGVGHPARCRTWTTRTCPPSAACRSSPSRSASIVFGAIHGAGKTNVLPVLERAGFSVQPVPEQLEPDSSFPTAAGKLINPEYREVVYMPGRAGRAAGRRPGDLL